MAKQRKALQLCRQVLETLTYVLGAECGDERLGDLEVVDVVPWHNESTLRAALSAPAGTTTEMRAAYEEMLIEAQPTLRAAVGEAITRRRVPQILLVLQPPEDNPPDDAICQERP